MTDPIAACPRPDRRLLEGFEESLNPAEPERASPPASILGYGEISCIFQIGDDEETAYKRLPLFDERADAEAYIRRYTEYCGLLREAGLTLPGDAPVLIEVPGRPVVLYIAQRRLPAERFGHRLLHTLERDRIEALIERVAGEIGRIWEFNRKTGPDVELAIDGQISNWVWLEAAADSQLVYVDTSTPLFRREGRIQLDPELFLKSAPSFLRWIIRWLFLEDVMTRYFDPRQVYTDLAANLFKEQVPELIPPALASINCHLTGDEGPLTHEEVAKYYKGDKVIWAVFLAFRRFDRWLKLRLLRRRYEFILPGAIER